MNFKKVLAVSAVFFGAMTASSGVFAHASYNISGSAGAGSPVWLNGTPVSGVEFPSFPNSSVNIPSTAFAGVHGATASNTRVIETGIYGASTAVTATQLGGTFNGITPTQGNTLEGQLFTYNGKNPSAPLSTTQTVSVQQGSWGNGVSSIYNAGTNTFNQGDLYLNPYAGSGATAANPNGEFNIIGNTGAQYLNVSIAADNVAGSIVTQSGAVNNSGTNELAYAIYQGVATGPGLQGLVLLGTGVASNPGQEVDFSIALQGAYLNNNPNSAGGFTLVVGDVSQNTDSTQTNYIAAGQYDQYIKIGLSESGYYQYGPNAGNPSVNTAAGITNFGTIYNEQGTVPAVPVPGAVWLFGTAVAGYLGLGRRKQIAA